MVRSILTTEVHFYGRTATICRKMVETENTKIVLFSIVQVFFPFPVMSFQHQKNTCVVAFSIILK